MNVNDDYSGKTIGKYHLIEKLGKGHFGAVYSAIDFVLNSTKAIKIMNVTNPSQAFKLFEEAAIPHKCAHNNIVRINGGSLESFENEVHFVIDMELVDGGSLEDLMRSRQISVLDTLEIIKSALFGLQHSHNQGIVHRDIKPANILISNGIPKLSDFGLASTLNEVLPNDALWYYTHSAPEFKTTLTPTIETDIYALGVTMYRAVNCIINWRTYLKSIKSIDRLIDNGTFIEKVQFEPFVPKKVIRIIKKACKPDPANRYHSAAEMRNAIEKLLPQTNWLTQDNCVWTGTTERQIQTAHIINLRRGFEVQVKINGRRNNSYCKRFALLEEAEEYLYDYISTTTVK